MSKELISSEIDKKNKISKKFFKVNNNNRIKDSVSYRVFSFVNYTFLILLAALCLFPLLQVLAVSLSHDVAIKAGKVILWPVDYAVNANGEAVFYPMRFNISAYKYMISNTMFWTTFLNSIFRVVIGTSLSMFLVVICSYPLSQDPKKFPMRMIYVWFFFFSTLFGGGLIPGFYITYKVGFFNSIWVLIIPGCIHVWNIILLLNFFRQLPKELDEAAFMDGAGHWTILFKIYLPTSLPALATITLFTLVAYWNEWFTAIVFMNNKNLYPLATYLQEIIVKNDASTLPPLTRQTEGFDAISTQNTIAAQIFIGAVPILIIYPFLQKYFAKGIVLGSVKG